MTITVKNIGEALVKNCPDNDCVIFKNLFLEHEAIQEDLRGCILSSYSRHILEEKCRKIAVELHRMTYENYAVNNFKKQLNKGL